MNAIKYSHPIIKISFSYRIFLYVAINLTFIRYLFKLYLHIYLLNKNVLNAFHIRTNVLALNQKFYKLHLTLLFTYNFFYVDKATFLININWLYCA